MGSGIYTFKMICGSYFQKRWLRFQGWRKTPGHILSLLLTCCVTLGKSREL